MLSCVDRAAKQIEYLNISCDKDSTAVRAQAQAQAGKTGSGSESDMHSRALTVCPLMLYLQVGLIFDDPNAPKRGPDGTQNCLFTEARNRISSAVRTLVAAVCAGPRTEFTSEKGHMIQSGSLHFGKCESIASDNWKEATLSVFDVLPSSWDCE